MKSPPSSLFTSPVPPLVPPPILSNPWCSSLWGCRTSFHRPERVCVQFGLGRRFPTSYYENRVKHTTSHADQDPAHRRGLKLREDVSLIVILIREDGTQKYSVCPSPLTSPAARDQASGSQRGDQQFGHRYLQHGLQFFPTKYKNDRHPTAEANTIY